MPVVFTDDGEIDEVRSTDDQEEDPVFACPVCGKITLPYRGSYYMCDNCNWFDDPGQSEEYPNEEDCLNKMSLNQAREAYKAGKTIQ